MRLPVDQWWNYAKSFSKPLSLWQAIVLKRGDRFFVLCAVTMEKSLTTRECSEVVLFISQKLIFLAMLPVNRLRYIEINNQIRRRRMRQFNLERRIARNNNNPFELDDLLFVATFRLSKELARDLIIELYPHMRQNAHPNSLTPEMRIFTALLFVSSGSYQRLIGQSADINVCQATVSNCVREVSQLISDHLAHLWIKFPTAFDEKTHIKETFLRKTRFPGVIGCIDCTHIRILKPVLEEHNYVNRKGYHSKNIQIICNFDLVILGINPRHVGATHDAFIWRTSSIRQYLSQCYTAGDNTSWLLGDSGYPIEPWLLTPIQNAELNSPENLYNRRHASARNCVERCNGVLKTRFRCLLGERTLRYTPQQVAVIVTACAVLHNMCIKYRLALPDIPEFNDEREEDNNGNVLNIINDIVGEGRRVREAVVRRYFSFN